MQKIALKIAINLWPDEVNSDPIRDNLFLELTEKGIKYSPEDIIEVRRGKDGQVNFLETGNQIAGFTHIQSKHGVDFERAGISQDELSKSVITAACEGTVVGYQGIGKGRPIFEYDFDGEKNIWLFQLGQMVL